MWKQASYHTIPAIIKNNHIFVLLMVTEDITTALKLTLFQIYNTHIHFVHTNIMTNWHHNEHVKYTSKQISIDLNPYSIWTLQL
jgi:hypothetical protein